MKTATQTSPKETVMTATKTTAQQIIDDHPYDVGFASKDAGGKWHHNAEDLEEVAGWWVFADGSAVYTRTNSIGWRDTARVAKPPASAEAPEVEPVEPVEPVNGAVMANDTAAAYVLDRRNILHRPNGQIASRVERESWEATVSAAVWSWVTVYGVRLGHQWACQRMANAWAGFVQSMPVAPISAPQVNLWKVERDRLKTARLFGWVA